MVQPHRKNSSRDLASAFWCLCVSYAPVFTVEQNGRALSGKCTRYINIQYFFITDRVNMKEISIDWCPTKKMVADFMTKPSQASNFWNLRDYIISRVQCIKSKADVISLGRKASKNLVKKRKVYGKCPVTVSQWPAASATSRLCHNITTVEAGA